MKRLLAFTLLSLTTSCFGGANAINLHGGYHRMTEDYGDLEDMPVGGLEAVVGVGGGWGLEGAAFYAEESKNTVTLKSKELDLGLRKTFLQGAPVQLFIGAGPNYMEGDVTGLPGGDGLGVYGHGGVQIALFTFQIGLDFRAAYSEAKIEGERLNYAQTTIFIGFTF